MTEEIKRGRGRPKGTNNKTADMSKYNKEYYLANKERLLKIWSKKEQCRYCDSEVNKYNMSRHVKTHHPKKVK